MSKGCNDKDVEELSQELISASIESNEDTILKLRREFYHYFLRPNESRKHSSRIIVSIARRKYCPQLSQPQLNNAREVLNEDTMTEEKFLQLLQRIEFHNTQAVDPKTKQPIPPSAWVMYITANPLDEKKAYFMHLENMNKRLKDMCMGQYDIPLRAISDYKTCLHRSPYKEVIKLDVDTKADIHMTTLLNTLRSDNIKVCYALESRGGYHVLIPCGQHLKNLWLLGKNVTAALGTKDTWLTVEAISRSPQLAIPGTTQGSWLVRPTALFDEFRN